MDAASKFLWKGYSESIGATLSVAIAPTEGDYMVFVCTLFCEDKDIDSFILEVEIEHAKELLAEAKLVEALENSYIQATTEYKKTAKHVH